MASAGDSLPFNIRPLAEHNSRASRGLNENGWGGALRTPPHRLGACMVCLTPTRKVCGDCRNFTKYTLGYLNVRTWRIYYCSRECQAAHWKIHKPACGRTCEARQEAMYEELVTEGEFDASVLAAVMRAAPEPAAPEPAVAEPDPSGSSC